MIWDPAAKDLLRLESTLIYLKKTTKKLID